MRVTHAPLYHSARCIFSWTVLPGTEGGGGGLRTRGERGQQPSIKISETGYFLATEACFSCREACVTRFYPARYTRRQRA